MKSYKKILFVFLITSVAPSIGRTQNLSTDESNSLLDRLAKSRAGGVIQADFREKRFLPMLKEPIVETGKIAFEQPDKLLRKVDNGNLTVSDGKILWMYYPEFKQAEKYPLSGVQGPGEFFLALTKIFQLHNLEKYFRVELIRIPDGYRLELSPRGGTLRRMMQHASVELRDDLRLRSSVITGSEGDRIETIYSNERILPPGAVIFSFAPASDINVVTPLGD